MLVRNVGTAIKKRRKALKITQSHLAELAGISVNSLYKIERGEVNPTLDLIEKIANERSKKHPCCFRWLRRGFGNRSKQQLKK